ncbi:sensor histidine kinase [Cellulosimicrobium funkei]
MIPPGPEPAEPAALAGRAAPSGRASSGHASVDRATSAAGRVAPVVPAATRWLRRGLDVLLVGLVALAVAGALVTSTARGAGAVLLGAALLALYVVGRRRVPVPVDVRAPRGAWWPAGAWVTGLVALWVGLSLVTTTAVWVAFPLMFVAMHVLGPRRGPVAVAVVVVLVVGVMAAWTARVALPFVLGPAIGGAVAVVVVLALEAVVRESQERQRTLDELVRTRDELAASERERAVAAERERLAREIHDTLAQGFSSAELLLRAARTALDAGDAETARGYVEQTREVARHNLAEARRVVRALAPADLASSNLVGALRRVADRASGRAAEGGPRVVVRVSGEPVPLPTEVEAALLRVAQSALANVERHAGATRAAVTVSFLAGTGPGDDAVALDVVDDGRGFDPDAVPAPAADRPGGFGLGAMRARVADLGGTLSVESAPGAGPAGAAWVPPAATTGNRSGAAADHRADAPADRPADRLADGTADTRTETDAGTEEER